jgi:hypothetical protein
MKKIFVVLVLALIFVSCDNDDVKEEDKGPFSLIGTWEASGEFPNDSGKIFTYKCTLIFDETEFKETTHCKSEDGLIEFSSRIEGSYIQEEKEITGTWCQIFESGSTTEQFEFAKPYKFINKNTLDYTGLQLSIYISTSTFKRK